MNTLERMDSFFEKRVEEYDEHMLNEVEGCKEGYIKMAQLIPDGTQNLLDLGCVFKFCLFGIGSDPKNGRGCADGINTADRNMSISAIDGKDHRLSSCQMRLDTAEMTRRITGVRTRLIASSTRKFMPSIPRIT